MQRCKLAKRFSNGFAEGQTALPNPTDPQPITGDLYDALLLGVSGKPNDYLAMVW